MCQSVCVALFRYRNIAIHMQCITHNNAVLYVNLLSSCVCRTSPLCFCILVLPESTVSTISSVSHNYTHAIGSGAEERAYLPGYQRGECNS